MPQEEIRTLAQLKRTLNVFLAQQNEGLLSNDQTKVLLSIYKMLLDVIVAEKKYVEEAISLEDQLAKIELEPIGIDAWTDKAAEYDAIDFDSRLQAALKVIKGEDE